MGEKGTSGEERLTSWLLRAAVVCSRWPAGDSCTLNVKRKTFFLGQIKIFNILTELLQAVRQHHVKMEADFVNTVISISLLEGIG